MRRYLAESLRALERFAASSPDDLHDHATKLAEGEGTNLDRELALLAVYWVTGKQFYSASPSLHPSRGNVGGSGRSCWRFVGIFPTGDAPRYYRDHDVARSTGATAEKPPPTEGTGTR